MISLGLPELQKVGIVNATNNSLPCQCCCNKDQNQPADPGFPDPEPDPEPLASSSSHPDPIDDPVPAYELEPSGLQQLNQQKEPDQEEQVDKHQEHEDKQHQANEQQHNEQQQQHNKQQQQHNEQEQQIPNFFEPKSSQTSPSKPTSNSSTQTINNFSFALAKSVSEKFPSLSLTQEVPDVLL